MRSMELSLRRCFNRTLTLAPSAGPTGGAGLALPAASASFTMPVTAATAVIAAQRAGAGSGRRGPSPPPPPCAQPHQFRTPWPPSSAVAVSPFAAIEVTLRDCCCLLLAALSCKLRPAKRGLLPCMKLLLNAGCREA